jgi:hypothetical protein
MTCHKNWLVNLDESLKSKVKFAYDSTILVEGSGNVAIRRRDRKTAFVENVLYVPSMRCNFLSLGQLV